MEVAEAGRACKMRVMFRTLFILLVSVTLVLAMPRASHAQSAPPGFAAQFAELAGYMNSDELGGLEMAQATLLATRVFGAGTQAMPYVRGRFAATTTEGEAGLAGIYLVCHGGEGERQTIRKQSETDARKRQWIWNHVATEERFFNSISEGEQWRPAVSLIPSAAKCAALSRLSMESPDMVTRRAGMYWGFLVADAAYWQKIRVLSDGDKDALTKKIATRLLTSRSKGK